MRPDLKELLLRDDGSGTLLYMRLYKGMREAFSRGLLQPGERLPTDMEMARELGVNHLTLKKTLCRLAKEGFLTRQRGRGTAVAAVLPAAAPFQAGSRVTVLLDAVSEATLRSDTFVSICKGVNALGMTIELVSSHDDRREQFRQITELFSTADSGGCIVWPIMDMRQLEQLAAARPQGYPLVFINYRPELDIGGIDFSGYDDFGAGRLLGEHLLSQGYEEVLVLHNEKTKHKGTNVNRLAGITSGWGNREPRVFTGFTPDDVGPVQNALRRRTASDGKAAAVFISDTDYLACKGFLNGGAWTPFVFFTSVRPDCGGILLSSFQMGTNAVRILEARRKGDAAFSITRRVQGVLV